MNISTNPLYKVFILDKHGNPSELFIFNADKQEFTYDDPIFDNEEKLNLEKYSVSIKTSNQKILLDDSIRSLKRKILKETNFNQYSYEEMYLFANKYTNFHFSNIYPSLDPKLKGLSKAKLGQFLMNIQLLDQLQDLESLVGLEKDFFSYEDIESILNVNNKDLVLSYPLGHMFDKYQEPLFSANPFSILASNEEVFKMTIENPLLTFENSLLLNYPTMHNNSLYVCLAEDVLSYSLQNGFSNLKILQYYFPLLISKNIDSIEKLQTNKQSLISDTKQTFETISDERINIFYEIMNKPFNVNYDLQGITKVSITLHPERNIILPLENIFKQSFTSEDIPMIKYKPGFKKEELYRLHTVGYAENGKKIPYLSKLLINQYSKKVTGYKSYLLFLLKKRLNNKDLYISCNVVKNGNIIFDVTIDEPVAKDILSDFLIGCFNNMIEHVNIYLQKQYHYSFISNLEDSYIEVNDLNYICELPSLEEINTKQFSILTNLFTILELNTNEVKMRYKRVNNYKEMDSINALINKLYKQNMDDMTIIQSIVFNFDILPTKANEYLLKYLNEFTLVHGNYVNKAIDVVDNPGFSTIYKYDDVEKKIIFNVQDIDSFQYISLIQAYIESFLKIALRPEEIGITKAKIDLLSRETQKSKKDATVENVIVSENVNNLAYKQNINGIIRDKQDKEDEVDEDEGIFFGDDDEEDEEDEEEEEEGEENDDDEEGNDDDEEEEEEEEENDDDEKEGEEENDDDDDDDSPDIFMTGGNRKNTSGTTFYNRLKKYEPVLFAKESESMYAKICPSTSNRQPVILTEEEKRLIDEDPIAKSAYGISIKYGTNPDKPYWYMCPRYWCLNTNKPMTEEQVKNGECGGKIIPAKNKTKIPEGHYIYEFTDDRQHKDADGNYLYHNPGFLDKSKSSQNLGIPCCFKNPFGSKQNTRRHELNISDDDISYGNEEFVTGKISDKLKNERTYKNVLSIERTPLPEHRWGFLPLSIELFLRTNNSDSVEPNNPSYILKSEAPLLRYGVEKSSKKSFIACIADIYTYHNDMKVPSIPEMTNIIIEKLTLDYFLQVHNGNLVSMFRPRRINSSDLNTEKYSNTKFYRTLNLNNSSQNTFLKNTIASYESFISFLRNEDSIVDHTLLWDIVCSKQIGIFPNGLNLAIMEIENNDIRDNVSLICPSNSYIDSYFDENKGTVMLIKNNEHYEPVYVYGNTRNENASNKVNAVKIFYKENTPSNLVSIMSMISNSMSTYCKPKDKPKVYKYKTNLSAFNIKNIGEEHELIFKKQVMDYRGKIIGFLVSSNEDSNRLVFLPTQPSNAINNIETILIDDVEWLPYSTTIQMLKSISDKTNGKILSKPLVKIEEQGLIVGIITETNQFVYLNEPIQNTENDDIETVKINGFKDYFEIDKSLSISTKQDDIRVNTVQNISLESKFYIQFRNKLKDELLDLMNQSKMKKLESLASSKEYIYEKKRILVEEIIRELLEPNVNFVSFSADVLKTINNTNNIFTKNNHSLCLHDENLLCLPDKNLINGIDNELLYYLRLSDEIVRFHRVRSFLFNPEYMHFSNLEYNLLNSELLLIQSHINGDYFDTLPVHKTNKYVENIPYDIAFSSQEKNNKNKIVNLSVQNIDNVETNMDNLQISCVDKHIPIGTNNNWNNIFDNESREIKLNNRLICGYYVLSYILFQKQKIKPTIPEIKKLLIKAYESMIDEVNIEDFKIRILNILSKQLKKQYALKIKKKQLTFENMILNENYFISHFDIWILCYLLDIPVVIYSNEKYKNMQLNSNYIVTGGNMEKDDYLFIKLENNNSSNVYMDTFSIIEPKVNGQKLLDKKMTKLDLKQHLRRYRLYLQIKA